MRKVVWIHTQRDYEMGARVAAYLLKSRSASPDQFEVRLLRLEDSPELLRYEGRSFRWTQGGKTLRFSRQEPQAFIFLRRRVPELMGFEGRAVLLDPDIFAVGDVHDLLSQDMGGHGLMVTPARGGGWSTAVMLLDCAKMRHWQWQTELQDLFEGRRYLGDLLRLKAEPPAGMGVLEQVWNDCDTLSEKTQLLHMTDRRRQPWLTGLPYRPDFSEALTWKQQLKRLLWPPASETHQAHALEAQFFAWLREAVQAGAWTIAELQAEVQAGRVRTDLLRAAGLSA